jgi:hypothetical protein
MRSALMIALFFTLTSLPQQTNFWQHVGDYNPVHLNTYSPNQAQLASVRKTLLSRERQDGWACQETEDDWTEGLTFEALPVSATKKIVLVEAGTGCARGGQGRMEPCGASVRRR